MLIMKGKCIDFITILFLFVLVTMGFSVPLLNAETYQLKEGTEIKDVFTIGVDDEDASENDPYLFYSIARGVFDSKGFFYILDIKEHCVKVFDKNGKYKRRLFREGQGPGEISNELNMAINHYKNDSIFILQDYGYTMLEFKNSGKRVKRRMMPKQFFGQFTFYERDKLLYSGFNSERSATFDRFKLFNLETGKIEKEFAQTHGDEIHTNFMRFARIGDTIWTAPGDKMVLQSFDFNSGKALKEITIPGQYKKNTFYLKESTRGRLRILIFFNFSQPFAINETLFLMVAKQEYKKADGVYEKYPFKSQQDLFMLKGDSLVNLGTLKTKNLLLVEDVWENRILLRSIHPYPIVKMMEINIKK